MAAAHWSPTLSLDGKTRARYALNGTREIMADNLVNSAGDVLRIEGASPEPPRKAQQPAALDAAAYAADSDTEKLNEDSIGALAVLAEEMIIETRNMARLQKQFREAESRYADVAEKRLPDLMEKFSLPR